MMKIPIKRKPNIVKRRYFKDTYSVKSYISDLIYRLECGELTEKDYRALLSGALGLLKVHSQLYYEKGLIRQQRISGKIGDALRDYGVSKALPKDSVLREWVLRFTQVAEMMKDTLPKHGFEAPPHPTTGTQFPQKIIIRGYEKCIYMKRL
jgi:hypothetical protein